MAPENWETPRPPPVAANSTLGRREPSSERQPPASILRRPVPDQSSQRLAYGEYPTPRPREQPGRGRKPPKRLSWAIRSNEPPPPAMNRFSGLFRSNTAGNTADNATGTSNTQNQTASSRLSWALPWEAKLVDNVGTPELQDNGGDRYSTYFQTSRPAGRRPSDFQEKTMKRASTFGGGDSRDKKVGSRNAPKDPRDGAISQWLNTYRGSWAMPWEGGLVGTLEPSDLRDDNLWNTYSRLFPGQPFPPDFTEFHIGDRTSSPRSSTGSSLPDSEATEVEDKEKAVEVAKAEKSEGKGDDEANSDPYDGLPPYEVDILKRQVDVPERKYGFFSIYRYASKKDIIILIISTICAIASGAAMPFMTVIFGGLQGTFNDYFKELMPYSEFLDELTKYVLYFVYLGIGSFVVTYICTVGFIYTGEHITATMREAYLKSCLKQNIGYYDKVGSGEVVTRITSETNMVQDGISEKVSLTIQGLATFIVGIAIGFAFYWKLALILMSTVVALILNTIIGSKFILKCTGPSLQAYVLGASLIDEVLSSVRTAVAFGTQGKLAAKYDVHLEKAEHWGIKVKHYAGWMVAVLMSILYLNFGLGFWQGSTFILNGEVPLRNVLTTMMALMIGGFSMGGLAPNIQAFLSANAAAQKILTSIDRPSAIDPSTEDGGTVFPLRGDIRLENVKHIYPSRPGAVVMNNVSLDIPAGKTTALVGPSGSGKSTIVGLLERFYEPVAGRIYIDGRDISTLNLKWLRQQIALVSQEPTLFATTIFENIRYGLIGTPFENETEEQQRQRVERAARMANAHEFISLLGDRYDTHVGERGFLLSGGQKQRIAIARGIVSDPKILLLDEATSALDTKSEGVVQQALDAAARGRTTITIAHRLSTIRDADQIVVMADGGIVEQGTHDQLMLKKSSYFNLVNAQGIDDVEDDNSSMDVDDEKMDAKDYEMMRRSTHRQSYFEGIKRWSTAKSISSMVINARPEEQEQKYTLWQLIKFIASFNSTDKTWMGLGTFFAMIAGGAGPTAAVFYAKQLSVLSIPIAPTTRDLIRDRSNFWSTMYLMLGLVMLLAYGIQGFAFAKASERLIRRLRIQTFKRILRQDTSFFDKDENSAGALTSYVAIQTTYAAGLSGATLGTMVTAVTTLVAGIVVSIAIGWKLALVCTATLPVLLGCGFFRVWTLAQFEKRAKGAYAASAGYASEAVSAIKTVAALTREDQVFNRYHESIKAQQKRSLRSVLKSSLIFAASQSLLFFCFGLGFWYGGTLIAKLEYTMFQFFLCFMAVMYGSQSAGTFFSLAPDMGKAHQAASELKKLFDRKPVVDTWSDDGKVIAKLDGGIEFRDVHFRYPTRPETSVLRGLNMDIRPGQYVALVGGSGCGKSTAIAMLERFYDPLAGGVFVDGKDISTLNINDYRSFVALVGQEPTLYQGTIRENLMIGCGRTEVSDKAMEEACREANIHDFITSLPDGYNTVLGPKGGMLSGGQKQRIAIARALVRNPKVLLLDEATSALDSKSEHVVQAALDKAAKGRTTVTIAHRLSTIQHADCIFVLDKGRVVEKGTHADLMRRDGRYAELVRLQSMEKDKDKDKETAAK